MATISLIFGSIYSLISLLLLNTASSYVLIPGVSVLIASYAAFQTTIPNLLLLIVAVWLSSVIGDYSVYLVSRKLSMPVRKFLNKFKWFNQNEEKVKKSLANHEFSAVFYSRFLITGVAPVINYLSGFEKLNAKKFFLAVLSGELVFALIYSLIGYIFRDTWRDLLNTIQYSFIALVGIIIALYLIRRIIRYYRREKIRII